MAKADPKIAPPRGAIDCGSNLSPARLSKKLDSSEALRAAPSPGNLIAGRIGGISAYDLVVIAWGYDCCTNVNADATAHIGPTISAAPIDAADMNTASTRTSRNVR
jgi:hypothetical protein